MILNIKYFVYLTLIVIGFYFIYTNYLNLIKVNFSNNHIKTSKIENKESDNFEEITKIQIENNNKEITLQKVGEEFQKQKINVLKGDTFSSILNKFNLSEREIFEIINIIGAYFDLRKLNIGQEINFFLNNNKEVQKIEIYKEIDNVLVIEISEKINVFEKKLKKEIHQVSKEFYILESLYSDGLKNDIPQSILIDLIKLFSFDLDFQRDIRVNTLVSLSFEYIEIKENNSIKYKDINYALISINEKKIEYFKFLTDEGYTDYFNREGKNVKKSILKTPLDGARISSNFGMRKHPISGFNKMHKGVDFAAPIGTPIYAGGNGVVEYIGYNGGYGKYIRIRHNNDYKTAYAHLSSYKKGISQGVRVNQGDIIGYVGSTGRSTGPHLHYEILFKNKQINPLNLKLPSGKILKGDELKRFNKEHKKIYADHLNLLYE